MQDRATDSQLFLPTSTKELEMRGWKVGELDVILFTGDAYVDHPSFGAAVIGRTLEAQGYKVAIVPQPNWRDDLRDFRKLGRPRLFFGVTAGAMDSMVNKYTANRRLRSEDAYTPDGRHDMRPEYPSIVYSHILKQLFPDVPVILGGIEASMRRLTHFDYWQKILRPSILADSAADMLVYGMGELPIVEIAERLNVEDGIDATEKRTYRLRDVPQTAYLTEKVTSMENDVVLASHEICLHDHRAQAANYRIIEEESNSLHARRIIQQTIAPKGIQEAFVVVNAPFPPMTTEQVDRSYDLPYTRLPHPRYKNKRIPAYDMIKHSVNIHRGCFGGCAFCTISAHQGKFIASRSKKSILREVKAITEMPDFHGTITDLGGPSANMYGMGGRDHSLCERCRRPSCIHPNVCKNLNTDHTPLVDLYRAVDKMPGVKHSYISSGIRYDLALSDSAPKGNDYISPYLRETITHHVSGRLKVAPEHTSDTVLKVMRKPSFREFEEFKLLFDRLCREQHLPYQLIPYFISSHPGCTAEDMAELAVITKRLNFHLEQIQDFTPTPMTISTETWYTGLHPYTLTPVFSAHTPQEKLDQRRFFFWYKPEERRAIIALLKRMRRTDLINLLFK